tara:strand:+ start:789 stop:1724 length:936 start_codon:yes stop_codon:yes gene_type:complete
MKFSTKELANQIRTGQYPTERRDTTQFFTKLGDGVYVPDEDTRIQVRDTDRDISRVERGVNKIKSTGDSSGLKPLTLIYFPKWNIEKLLNGNHTAEMEVNCGIDEADAHIVNFDEQLDGSMAKVKRLGNLLNLDDVETVSTGDNDIRGELYELMNENYASTQNAKPTEEQINDFIETYPQITRGTIGQWISNHDEVGSRNKPKKSYTKAELQLQRESFNNQLDYQDYAVLEPRTLAQWRDTGISSIFNDCMEEGKKKALAIFYCSTLEQVEQLKRYGKGDSSDVRNTIEQKYARLGEYWGVKIKTIFLRYE